MARRKAAASEHTRMIERRRLLPGRSVSSGSLMLAAFLALLCSSWAGSAIAARPQQPGREQPPSRYERLLKKYLEGPQLDSELAAAGKQQQREREEYRQELEGYRRRGGEITDSETAVLEELRVEAKKQGRRLLGSEGPEGDWAVVGRAFVPTSDASARIFASLLKEDLISSGDVLSLVWRRAGLLSSGWVAVVEGIGRASKPGSPTWQNAMFILYQAEPSDGQYRRVLERLVREEANDGALRALFSETDWQTGQQRTVITPWNIALMSELAGSSNPEIRVTCAGLAAEAGDLAMAESICTQLLTTRYKGFDNVDGPTPEEDRPLYRARSAAMQILFYRVHNERAFKLIYDESLLPWSQFPEKFEPKPDPKGWVRADAYVLMSMEIDEARGLISMVEDREDDYIDDD